LAGTRRSCSSISATFAPDEEWPLDRSRCVALQGLMCYTVVMGFMFALSDIPEVQVAIAQPLVPALALGMSSVFGMERLSFVSALGIAVSIAGKVSQNVNTSTSAICGQGSNAE
jgi:drug/metabolite transporter (DMT)-like permease